MQLAELQTLRARWHTRLSARNAEVVRLAMDGVLRDEIARRFGISLANVSVIVSQARNKGVAIPRFTKMRGAQLPREGVIMLTRIKRLHLQYFRRVAGERNCEVGALLNQILSVIAEDEMIDAVLDDDGDKR